MNIAYQEAALIWSPREQQGNKKKAESSDNEVSRTDSFEENHQSITGDSHHPLLSMQNKFSDSPNWPQIGSTGLPEPSLR